MSHVFFLLFSRFISGDKKDDFDWLDLIPWDAVSNSDAGSVVSTPGPSSPISSPTRNESPTDAATHLLEQSAEEFLPIFDSPASPALSVIDDEDTLFAALRLNPQQVLAESEARLASRASSVGHASDLESDKEEEETKTEGQRRFSFGDLFGDGDTDDEQVKAVEETRPSFADLFGDGDLNEEESNEDETTKPFSEKLAGEEGMDLLGEQNEAKTEGKNSDW